MIIDTWRGSATRRLSFALAQATLAGCALLTWYTMPTPAAGPQHAFNGLLVSDVMAGILKLSAYIAVSATLIYSRAYLAARGLLSGEFLTLLLFALLGIMVMISANSFLTLYLGLELMSLCLYALVAL